jgi:hypothetical protein
MPNRNSRPRTTRIVVGRTLGRAVRWVDDWTVEAFNPVYPQRGGKR